MKGPLQDFLRNSSNLVARSSIKKHVVMPRHVTDIKLQLDMMKAAGFRGCMASTSDATHVPIINCRFGLKQSYLGWKLSTTSRTYNISVTGTRRILSSTGGHPSRWNDKSIVMFDDFFYMDDVTFTLAI